MAYEVPPLPFKPPRFDGRPDRRLVSHYRSNHGGAARRLNAIEERHATSGWTSSPFRREVAMKRRTVPSAAGVAPARAQERTAADPTDQARAHFRAQLTWHQQG